MISSSSALRFLSRSFLFATFVVSALGQNKQATTEKIDYTGLLRETQQAPKEPGYVGLVWWTPAAFWEQAAERAGMSETKAAERYAPLSKYTMIVTTLGKVGIGNVDWIPEAVIRDNITLRDDEGNIYKPVSKVSGDAEGLASILKPVFRNILGPMGDNVGIFFFSGTNKMARPIADPLAPGKFSVVIANLLGTPESAFEWQLPLTALSPPKYCPIGKERVQANWKYCPWHGNKLDEANPASSK